MTLSNIEAEQIADNALSINDKILAISIMDTRGNILAAKSLHEVLQDRIPPMRLETLKEKNPDLYRQIYLPFVFPFKLSS
jgi:hypothetical protein